MPFDALTAACETYDADPTQANLDAVLVADDAARFAAELPAVAS